MSASDPQPLEAAFEQLYDEQVRFVWRALRTFGVPVETLEDACQDVFVIVHRRFGAWDEGALRPWLWGVARRVAAARRRTSSRHRRKLLALPSPSPVEAMDAQVDARLRLERIAHAIDGLAPERREVYVLAELEQLPPREIAALLSCKLNTVYSRLRRAREDLGRALTRAGLDDQDRSNLSCALQRTTKARRSGHA